MSNYAKIGTLRNSAVVRLKNIDDTLYRKRYFPYSIQEPFQRNTFVKQRLVKWKKNALALFFIGAFATSPIILLGLTKNRLNRSQYWQSFQSSNPVEDSHRLRSDPDDFLTLLNLISNANAKYDVIYYGTKAIELAKSGSDIVLVLEAMEKQSSDRITFAIEVLYKKSSELGKLAYKSEEFKRVFQSLPGRDSKLKFVMSALNNSQSSEEFLWISRWKNYCGDPELGSDIQNHSVKVIAYGVVNYQFPKNEVVPALAREIDDPDLMKHLIKHYANELKSADDIISLTDPKKFSDNRRHYAIALRIDLASRFLSFYPSTSQLEAYVSPFISSDELLAFHSMVFSYGMSADQIAQWLSPLKNNIEGYEVGLINLKEIYLSLFLNANPTIDVVASYVHEGMSDKSKANVLRWAISRANNAAAFVKVTKLFNLERNPHLRNHLEILILENQNRFIKMKPSDNQVSMVAEEIKTKGLKLIFLDDCKAALKQLSSD